ncbi:hypothetical protein LXA43DRAFT_1069334 [Ganoderma leucocontextum]|nr:hypothetical protein LXA43DRAFT_1069334 [Ganoderma leucocontextum]
MSSSAGASGSSNSPDGAQPANSSLRPVAAPRIVHCAIPSWIASANANTAKLSLSKNNWPEWSQRIRHILNVSGGALASYLNGKVFAHWVSNDPLIRAYCETFAKGEDLRIIQNAASATAMWTALEDRRVKQGAYAQVLFLRDLLATRFDMSKPLDTQARDVVDLSERIVTMGNLTGDSLGVVALLHSLNFNLEHMVNQLINDQSKAKDALTCERIITRLHYEQQQIDAKARATMASASPPVALAASSATRTKDRFCANCKRPNHTAENCWSPGGGAEGQQDQYLARKDAHQKRDKKTQSTTPTSSSSSSTSSSTAPGKKVFRDSSGRAYFLDGDHVYPLLSAEDTALSAFSSIGGSVPLTTEAVITNDPASVPDWVHRFDSVALAAVAPDVSALVADGVCSWYLDSGASTHLSPAKADFISLRQIAPHAIRGVNGSTIHATAIGTILCPLSNGRTLELVDALYVPGAAVRLISIRALCDGHSNYSFTFSRSGVSVHSPSGNLVFEATRRTQTMFTLDPSPPRVTSSALVATRHPNIETIHRHYGHPSYAIAYDIAKLLSREDSHSRAS